MKKKYLALAFVAIACLALAGCASKRGGGPEAGGKPGGEVAQAPARPGAKQAADEALARALSTPPGADGMRLVSLCPPDEMTARDSCYISLVMTELLADIGRRTRQGAGVLAIEADPGPQLGQAGVECPGRVDLLRFKLVPKDIFTQGTIRPLLKSPCYSVVFPTKLTDCQCLSNIRDTMATLAGDARARGMVLIILDARRFGTWETGPRNQEGINVDAPGFDIVYALAPKPKNFEAAAETAFVPVEEQTVHHGVTRPYASDAPDLRITLPASPEQQPMAAPPVPQATKPVPQTTKPAAPVKSKPSKAAPATKAKTGTAQSRPGGATGKSVPKPATPGQPKPYVPDQPKPYVPDKPVSDAGAANMRQVAEAGGR